MNFNNNNNQYKEENNHNMNYYKNIKTFGTANRKNSNTNTASKHVNIQNLLNLFL